MKYSIVGFILWVVAGIYWIFQLISKVVPASDMSTETRDLDIFTLQGFFGSDWVDSIPWQQIHPAAQFINTTHLSLLMLAVGLIFIIIGMFFKT